MAKKKSGSGKRKGSKNIFIRFLKNVGIILWWIVKNISLGIYYLFKYLFLGTSFILKWLVGKVKSAREKIKIKRVHEEIEKAKPHSKAKYQEFVEQKKINGEIKEFYDLLYSPGKIGIILGARGTGKSALGMNILENIKAKHPEKEVYALGFDDSKLPSWVNLLENVEKIKEMKNNSFLLADESGINFSSRSSMSSANKLLSELMLIARHKDISITFITQNSSNIEVNTLRQADYMLLKPSSLLQLDFERKIVTTLYEKVKKDFEHFKEKGTTYVYSAVYSGFVKNVLPSFWSEGLSKSFAGKK